MTSSPNPFTRRRFLAGAAGTAALFALPGCGQETQTPTGSQGGGGDPWKQFSGTSINMISENTPPTAAIAANPGPFEQLTGIKLNIQQMEL
ncbi:MAG TPA: hypothetical protein VNT27_02105, partial [Propionibacteriaceae bacterium]|nr:hypothetical protein [Propionibacteriaceae bacterium]